MSTPQTALARRVERLAAKARTLAVVYFLVLFTATHVPSLPTISMSAFDKVEHFVGYGLLTLCVLVGWELSVGVLSAKHYFAMWLAGTLYAAFDELTQIPVGRTCDVNDWAADVLGIVLGLAAFCFVRGPLYRMLYVGEALRVE
jgi:VanZ family protein